MQFTGMEMQIVSTLAGLSALAITILYVLKLRKRRIEVPFSPLWQLVLAEQKKASELWQKLRRILSWLLYIIIAGLFCLALLDPHPDTEALEGRSVVLMLDNSASMGATDVSGAVDRLDLAKRKAREILNTLGPEDRVMLVTFNEQLRPMSPFVSETSIIEGMLASVTVSATGTSLTEAFQFAKNALEGHSRAELIILSDGAGAVVEVPELDSVKLHHVRVGESSGNLAITAFNVRRYLSNKLDYELFIGVRNYFERPVDAEIEIWADGALVDTKPIKIEAESDYQGYYPSQAVSGERLEARVRLTTRDARDVLPIDDRAYALLPPARKTRLQLVTEGNLYLEGPLLLNPNLEVVKVAPADYSPDRFFDVTVFDRVALPTGPTPNYLYIAPRGDDAPWEVLREARDPIIERITRGSPLLRWISLKDVNIGSADVWRTVRGDSVVAASESGVPILVTRSAEGKKFVGISFDIRNSDLPLRVAFPVLLINAVDWFMGDDGTLVETYRTGETWSVPVSVADNVLVAWPDGSERDVPVFERRAVFYGEAPGFYTVKDSPERLVAANVSDFEESAIAPRDLLGEQTMIMAGEGATRREIWVWLVLIALSLLVIEWFTYNRRMTV